MLEIKLERATSMNPEEEITIAIQQEDWALVSRLAEKAWGEKRLSSAEVLHYWLQALEWGDFQVRWDVSKQLPKLGELAIQPLLDLLEDDELEDEIRWFVVRSLGAWEDDAVIQTLWQIVQSSNPELQAMATTVLANYGDRVLTWIKPLLNSELPNVRVCLVRILANIRSTETLEFLLAFARDSDPQVCLVAIEALSSFQDDRIPHVVIPALSSLNAPLRQVAAEAIVFCQILSPAQRVECLEPLLWDLNVGVASKAAVSLGRLGNQATDPLLKALQSKPLPDALAVELVRSLLRVETPESLTGLFNRFDQGDLSESARQEILQGLGRVKSQPDLAVKYLIQSLKKSFTLVERQLAVTALGHLEKRDSVAVLIDQLRIPDVSLRLHIVRALQQIDRANLKTPSSYQPIQVQIETQLKTLDQKNSKTENCKLETRSGLTFALQEWR